jgi:hypothetical protein
VSGKQIDISIEPGNGGFYVICTEPSLEFDSGPYETRSAAETAGKRILRNKAEASLRKMFSL